MEYYKKIIKDKLKELVEYDDETGFQVAEAGLRGTQEMILGIFLAVAYLATTRQDKQDMSASFPFDDDLLDLIEDALYDDLSIIKRGAEAVDVIICELLAPIVAQEILDEIENRR